MDKTTRAETTNEIERHIRAIREWLATHSPREDWTHGQRMAYDDRLGALERLDRDRPATENRLMQNPRRERKSRRGPTYHKKGQHHDTRRSPLSPASRQPGRARP